MVTMTRDAAWIWCGADSGGRNAFARFRRRLVLERRPERAAVSLFGDARWRLWIDDAIVAYGPGRFVPAHPEFDTIDLLPWLAEGVHELLVEVWSPGCSTFQTMPESSGGLIAWGEIRCGAATISLATPGDWQAQRPTAWDAMAPSYSFAQGPVEVLDRRRLGSDPWAVPRILQEGPWGVLEARSLPDLGHAVTAVSGLRLAAALDTGESHLSCRCARDPRLPDEQRFAYALPIHARRAQRVSLGLFWGPHWLNGRGLDMANDPRLGNRQNTTVELHAGWNLLYGEPQILTGVWAQHIALPAAAGLQTGELRCGPAMRVDGVPSRLGRVPATLSELDGLGIDWRTGDAGHPARHMAWDRPGRALSCDLPLELDPQADPEGWVVVADAGGEFLGHIRVVIEAPAGTVLDVASDERLRDDGLLALYASNPFVDGADRFVLAGGRQEVELFHPRGGRFIQIAVRPPAGPGRVRLLAIAVRDHQVPVARDGAFACPDPVFTWAWETAHRTLQACVEDVFVDCPWRERGTYLGDALVEAATLAAFDRDPSIARRTLRLAAQAQRPDGLLQDCAPSWHRNPFGDFTLIWILLLHQLWARDGRLDEARDCWPVLERILASPALRPDDGGLCRAGPECPMFIDWGVDRADRDGEGNACLNAFRIRALACAAELAGALGRAQDAARLTMQGEAARQAFCDRLWLPEQGRFARRLVDGRPDPDGLAVHANALALAFGIAAGAQEPGVLAHVEHWVDRNLERALADREDGYLELYFLSYALEGLYRCGRTATAERVMREHWGHMQEAGAWTFWEAVRRGASGAGSLCHAWSSTPARWFHERILGVRPLRAGDPSHMLVAPDCLQEWAEGTVPHPAGPLRVAWRRQDGRLLIQATAPPGVTLHIAGGGSAERDPISMAEQQIEVVG